VGIGLGAAHIGVDIAPQWYSFVEERHILAPRVRSYFAPPRQNVQLVRVTKNVTNVTVINNRVVDRSIDVKNIEKVTKRPVTVHRIVEVDSPEQARGPRVRDKEREVVLVRPAVAKGSRDDNDGERREQEHARDRRDDDGKWRAGKNEQQLSERQRQERASEERQRQERQRREETAAEESRKRQEAEREESRSKARRQLQELQQQQAHEQRQQGRSGTAEERDRGDKPAWQQQPSQARQQAPASGTTEDIDPRSQRQRRQQLREEQGAEQRRQISTDAGDARVPRDRQSVLTTPQQSERATRPSNPSPEERRVRSETTRRGVEEDNTRRRNKKGEQQQAQEERNGNRQGTSVN
jgi:hypothetical protein